MAILVDPLFSDEARGTVAQTITFKRAPLFHPVVSQPGFHSMNWTPLKIAQAASWKSLCNQWRGLSDYDVAYWRDNAPGVLTGFNYFMQCKGVPPFAPCYSVPAGDDLDFDFVYDTYSPPAGDSLNFNWEACI